MRNLFFRVFIFSIPILIYISLIIIIDPYNKIDIVKNKPLQDIKKNISFKLNYPLFLISDYKNDPKDILFFGDSRTMSLDSEELSLMTKNNYFNFSYGGGTIDEIITTFWEVQSTHKPKEIFIGINFELYNDYNRNNRVVEALEIYNSYVYYVINKYSFKSLGYIIYNLIFSNSFEIGKLTLDKNQYWNQLVLRYENLFYRNYKYPKFHHKKLSEISIYCKNNNIELRFFIPPSHKDIINLTSKNNLESEYNRFVTDLNSFGPVLDLNFLENISISREFFLDPVHLNKDLNKEIVKYIFNKSLYIK